VEGELTFAVFLACDLTTAVQETQTRIVEFEEESAVATRCILEAIYGFEYDPGALPKIFDATTCWRIVCAEDWVRRVGIHVEVCLAADKYGIRGLKARARERMVNAAMVIKDSNTKPDGLPQAIDC
jgi:hypothetical protein